MLVIGVVVTVLAIGVWLYCLVDILLTTRSGCRHLPKPVWLAIAALAPAVGGVAWLISGRPAAERPHSSRRRARPFRGVAGTGPAERLAALARSRHPAGRARVTGPDDDPEFLSALDRMIRGGYDAGNDA